MLGHPGLKNKTLALVFLFAPVTNVFSQMPEVITPANAQRLTAQSTLNQEAWRLVIRPDGKRIALVGWNKPVQIFGVDFAMPFGKMKIPNVVEFDFSSKANVVAYSTIRGEGVTIKNLNSGEEKKLPAGKGQIYLSFSQDGERIATGSYGNNASIWNADTGKLLHKLDMGAAEGALRPFFSPDNKIVAVGHRNAQPRLFDAASGKLLHILKSNMSQGLVFHPDSRSLAVVYVNGDVVIWDVKSGEVIHQAKSDAEELYAVCWSPDGKLLATAGHNGSLTVWSAKDLRPLKKLKAPVKLFSVAFSPDGTQLLAGGHNGGEVKQYRIWRWKTK